MLKNKKLTYISLFSSAGVGCFGFKKAGYECIATNELIERRLNIQKINNKCSLDSGYICGDITQENTKKLIFEEIEKYKKMGNDGVDVLIATPPCQGMSVANHKKRKDEIVRNSLVVESIKIVSEIKPKFFVFENVSAFMKTGCTAPDNTIKEIGTVIFEELGTNYIIAHRILNFKNYGSNSSRTRTIVIGVNKSYGEYITPFELFPLYRKEKTLKEVIGDMPSLEWGEFSSIDFYHQFRTYPEHMRLWIHDLKQGESAFDNENPIKRPHKIVNGNYIPNKKKNGDKYTRQSWDKVPPCIHTRNDQLASQNTVHPNEDRVFSIRELMKMMTIPDEFKWIDMEMDQLNKLSTIEKTRLLKKEEINIRQSIGEAVPFNIFYQIANNIKKFMLQTHLNSITIKKIINDYKLVDNGNLLEFLEKNPLNLGYASLARIAELTNSERENNSAYYTNKFIINEIISELPESNSDEINILEPSVGTGNFLPSLMRKYESLKKVSIDICDIDLNSLKIVKILLEKIDIPENVKLNYIHDDFLKHSFNKQYFLVIGNPPFTKLNANKAKEYLKENINKETTNLFEFFLEKSMRISNYVAMITPKILLNTPEFKKTRKVVSKYKVDCIQDFGEQGFKGVLVETICLFINTSKKPANTTVISTTLNRRIIQKQKYIFDEVLPYWVIYRNDFFDRICKKIDLGFFDVFRDRQITNNNTVNEYDNKKIRVLKSRNVSDDGQEIIDIDGYDSYIDIDTVSKFSVYKYLDNDSVYLTPNMTYKPRVMKKKKGYLVNGSIAILIPKDKRCLTKKQLLYFASDEYRDFYKLARNYQTRSLNIDSTSVFWFGVLKGE